MADISKLEQQESFADGFGDRIAEWELFAVALICKELGRIGKMTPEQVKKYDAEKETKKTEKIILSALTTAVLLNIKDLSKTYTSLFDEWHKGNEYMYQYRGVPFVDVVDNKGLQKIINAYSKKSGAELLDFTKTKAIKVLETEQEVLMRKTVSKLMVDINSKCAEIISKQPVKYIVKFDESVIEFVDAVRGEQ